MRAICDDLGMKFAGAYSAAMYDLVQSKERERFAAFAGLVLDAINNDRPCSRMYYPLRGKELRYRPSMAGEKADPGGKKIVILTDAGRGRSTQAAMVERLKSSFAVEPPVFNLNDIDIKGGCLGCLQCGYDNKCVYGDSDGYREFFERTVKSADILFFCGEISDRYLSARWKLFFDRSFYNNHAPVLEGKQVGFLVSGPLSQLPNLGQILQAYAEFQLANLVDMVSDESGSSKELDARILAMAHRAVESAGKRFMMSRTFLSIGGQKIFRDEIWSHMRFPFIADDKYYKRNGLYDFPQSRKKERIISSIFMALTKIPGFRNEVYKKRMKAEMIRPLQAVLRE
jgi:hypothetical protein